MTVLLHMAGEIWEVPIVDYERYLLDGVNAFRKCEQWNAKALHRYNGKLLGKVRLDVDCISVRDKYIESAFAQYFAEKMTKDPGKRP